MINIIEKIQDKLYEKFNHEDRCARCKMSWTSRLYDDYECGCKMKPLYIEDFDFELVCIAPNFVKEILARRREIDEKINRLYSEEDE